MFTKETVLVLGAGSNLDYGFVSGGGLIKWMLGSGHGEQEAEELKNNLAQAGFERHAVEEFQGTLQFAIPPSIDQFLEGHHPKYTELGKLLIAQCLLVREHPTGLMTQNQGDLWYGLLLNEIAPKLSAIPENRLTIVTFNYDRSLEQFLFTAIKHRFGLNDEATAKALEPIRFIHVHGHLGYLHWQGQSSSLEYGGAVTFDRVTRAMKEIKVIYEADKEGSEFQQARRAIAKADYVFFFGFGYHFDSLERLGFPLKRAGIVQGTAFDIQSNRLKAITSRFPGITLHAGWKTSAYIEQVDHFANATAPA